MIYLYCMLYLVGGGGDAGGQSRPLSPNAVSRPPTALSPRCSPHVNVVAEFSSVSLTPPCSDYVRHPAQVRAS